MGSATNRPDQHRRYDAEYKLNDAEGIRTLLRDYDKLFKGGLKVILRRLTSY